MNDSRRNSASTCRSNSGRMRLHSRRSAAIAAWLWRYGDHLKGLPVHLPSEQKLTTVSDHSEGRMLPPAPISKPLPAVISLRPNHYDAFRRKRLMHESGSSTGWRIPLGNCQGRGRLTPADTLSKSIRFHEIDLRNGCLWLLPVFVFLHNTGFNPPLRFQWKPLSIRTPDAMAAGFI